ncbi:TIGR03749 family integrating conjugative element protein [Diaphorobacter sp. HDW4A]|uniref:TIGR03749 family integrating conjugative element protein n=1 Tax=Diaphorobacter sp. HDW4A TaxID=2714924 RepID=UPI0014072D65|nr:TIGR03749 family integrating conjugative element protein [Diaphorobacter sp. HDW4A]QIL80330.1 TIGR03749 family integrating conjugative element protein [Diaphorobacter sp. HDW4A]
MIKRYGLIPALACALLVTAPAAWAQQVQDLGPSIASVPADLIPANAAADNGTASTSESDGAAAQSSAATVQPSRVDQAISGAKSIRKPAQSKELTGHGTERAVFERAPVRVPLPVGAERLIALPAPAALHVPSDMDKVVRIEIIDRTIYATAKIAFTPLRVIAELIDTGQQIPLDLVADASTASARSELEVFVTEASPRSGPATQAAAQAAAQASPDAQMPEVASPDMVQLTRYAARQLYAPKRLATPTSGIQQVDVANQSLTDLFRGANVLSTPVGQWRAGPLYVTAVLVKNRARTPLEIPLEQVRGSFVAATAQHGRIGAADSETDTTAVYLVCERRFEACR